MRREDWPQEFRVHVLGNFRPQPFSGRPHVSRYRSGPDRDQAHLARVRAIGMCICCGRNGFTEAHHLRYSIERCFGQKSPDRWVLPLCNTCHNLFSSTASLREPEIFAEFGITENRQLFLAKRLYDTKSVDSMRVIVQSDVAHRYCHREEWQTP